MCQRRGFVEIYGMGLTAISEDKQMFVVTGASGHTGNVIAKALLAKGEKVRVVGRSADSLQALVSEGAEPSIADLSASSSLPSPGWKNASRHIPAIAGLEQT